MATHKDTEGIDLLDTANSMEQVRMFKSFEEAVEKKDGIAVERIGRRCVNEIKANGGSKDALAYIEEIMAG